MASETNLIVMLTCNDVTVANAREVFASCRDLPVSHWGFKDNGIGFDEMQKLAGEMKAADRKICFETLGVGNCTAGFATCIHGCPATQKDICDGLRRYILQASP